MKPESKLFSDTFAPDSTFGGVVRQVSFRAPANQGQTATSGSKYQLTRQRRSFTYQQF